MAPATKPYAVKGHLPDPVEGSETCSNLPVFSVDLLSARQGLAEVTYLQEEVLGEMTYLLPEVSKEVASTGSDELTSSRDTSY